MPLASKDLLGISHLSTNEIFHVLETADAFREILKRPIRKVPALRGKTVINFFAEASTRTRTSFELAAKYLSADTVNMSGSNSSLEKGETLIDTAKTLQAMNPRVLVIRHGMAGAAHIMAKHMDCGVINAGDGAREHPTQALLDLYSIRERRKNFEGLHVGIMGDILHSRVARSNILALQKVGASVTLIGPLTLMPVGIESLGVRIVHSLEEVISELDIIMVLRIQWERIKENLLPSIREFASCYCLTEKRLKKAKKDLFIMHPGPMNRGVEIAPNVADGVRSIVTNQVQNGLIVRMALLFLLCGGSQRELAN